MAPPLLLDLKNIDLNHVVHDIEAIRKINPHRYEMEQLTSVVYVDPTPPTLVGVKEVTMDEFWVRGHIPGEPIMPGVIMLEAAAQLCSIGHKLLTPHEGFMGFAKLDEVRFRATVRPPSKLYLIARMKSVSSRRLVADCQGVCNDTLVFEAVVTGMLI
jgi:3-hydroxyacyl-[acyl-carrier-protein] dehydratase